MAPQATATAAPIMWRMWCSRKLLPSTCSRRHGSPPGASGRGSSAGGGRAQGRRQAGPQVRARARREGAAPAGSARSWSQRPAPTRGEAGDGPVRLRRHLVAVVPLRQPPQRGTAPPRAAGAALPLPCALTTRQAPLAARRPLLLVVVAARASCDLGVIAAAVVCGRRCRPGAAPAPCCGARCSGKSCSAARRCCRARPPGVTRCCGAELLLFARRGGPAPFLLLPLGCRRLLLLCLACSAAAQRAMRSP
jgi:hypothetical protein